MTWTMNWRRYFARDSSKRMDDVYGRYALRRNYRDSTACGTYQEMIFYYGGIETLNCLATARTGKPKRLVTFVFLIMMHNNQAKQAW